MKNKDFYDERFYSSHYKGSIESAKKIVPLVMELVNPKNVVDVGCGIGTWLKVFNDLGIKQTIGIDGDYINKNQLLIKKENFIAKDLSKPVKLNKKFDLAISLEVAEHIDKRYSKNFIKSLTSLSDIILFSSAIPGQGGNNHINEQWPDYWGKLFKEAGYVMLDPFRLKIISEKEIEWWYRQNVYLVLRKTLLDRNKKFNQLPRYDPNFILIHESIINKRLNLFKKVIIKIKKIVFKIFKIKENEFLILNGRPN